MKKLNPCVTGSTGVWTTKGIKSFKELADTNEDVEVYCLDEDGDIKVSKMFHPRLTGYKVEIMRITLEDGTELNLTPNHMLLTRGGYVCAEDLYEGDEIIVMKKNVYIPTDIDERDREFTEYKGTKKGTVIKKCEVSGEEFECIWDEREVCTKEGYETDLYEMKRNISTVSRNYRYMRIQSIEFFDNHREDVYNGTVVVYHNYFTIDEKTQTIVNQLNCGE